MGKEMNHLKQLIQDGLALEARSNSLEFNPMAHYDFTVFCEENLKSLLTALQIATEALEQLKHCEAIVSTNNYGGKTNRPAVVALSRITALFPEPAAKGCE